MMHGQKNIQFPWILTHYVTVGNIPVTGLFETYELCLEALLEFWTYNQESFPLTTS